MNPAIIEADALRQALGCKRLADLEALLQRNGIRYFYGKNGPWTTLAALNQALGVAPPASNEATYSADQLL